MSKESVRSLGLLLVVLALVTGGLYWWLFRIMSDDKRQLEQECRSNPLPARVELFGVYMHRQHEYSGLVKTEDGQFEVSTLPYCRTLRFVFDAPVNQPAWLDISPESDLPCRCRKGVLHLHSPEGIHGAGWRRREGKTDTSGTTEVIE